MSISLLAYLQNAWESLISGSVVDTGSSQTISGYKSFTGGINGSSILENGTALSSKYLGISANAASATKATQDGSGSVITSTYLPNSRFYDAYLGWGGKNIAGGAAPVDVALSSDFNANRLAFMRASDITVEYSRDGGSTWVDYGATDTQKTLLTMSSTSLNIGGATSGVTTDYKLRVTLTFADGYLYFQCRKWHMRVSTNGASGCYVTMEGRTIGNYNDSADTWSTLVASQTVAGWSGWNVINGGYNQYNGYTVCGGGTTQTSQFRQVRLTFGITGLSGSYNNSLSLMSLRAYGENCWSSTNEMQRTGHLYSIGSDKTATFPYAVAATQFNENGTALSSKYLQTSNLTASAIITALGTNAVNRANSDGSGNTITSTYLPLSGGALTGKLSSAYNPAASDTSVELSYASTTGSGAHGIILRPSSTGSEFNGGHGLGVFNASAVDGANIVFFDGGKAASYNLSTHMDFCYRPNAKSWLNFGFYGNDYLMKLDTSGNFHINGDIYEGDTTGNGLGGTVLSSKYHPKTTVDTTATSGSAHLITSGAVYTGLSAKQNSLVSGSNIKTINGNSLLGSGNVAISGSGNQTTTILASDSDVTNGYLLTTGGAGTIKHSTILVGELPNESISRTVGIYDGATSALLATVTSSTESYLGKAIDFSYIQGKCVAIIDGAVTAFGTTNPIYLAIISDESVECSIYESVNISVSDA